MYACNTLHNEAKAQSLKTKCKTIPLRAFVSSWLLPSAKNEAATCAAASSHP